jgi:hypothetical protein
MEAAIVQCTPGVHQCNTGNFSTVGYNLACRGRVSLGAAQLESFCQADAFAVGYCQYCSAVWLAIGLGMSLPIVPDLIISCAQRSKHEGCLIFDARAVSLRVVDPAQRADNGSPALARPDQPDK